MGRRKKVRTLEEAQERLGELEARANQLENMTVRQVCKLLDDAVKLDHAVEGIEPPKT